MSEESDEQAMTREELAGEYAWLINDFADRVAGVAHGIAVAADGILIAGSRRLEKDRADLLAAVSAGLLSLTEGSAAYFEAGNVRETIVEMDAGTMLLMAIGNGSCFCVLTDPGYDIGQIAYEMALLVERFGRLLTPDERGSEATAVSAETVSN